LGTPTITWDPAPAGGWGRRPKTQAAGGGSTPASPDAWCYVAPVHGRPPSPRPPARRPVGEGAGAPPPPGDRPFGRGGAGPAGAGHAASFRGAPGSSPRPPTAGRGPREREAGAGRGAHRRAAPVRAPRGGGAAPAGL